MNIAAGYGIGLGIPDEKTKVFGFMDPFSTNIWILIVGCVFVTGTMTQIQIIIPSFHSTFYSVFLSSVAVGAWINS